MMPSASSISASRVIVVSVGSPAGNITHMDRGHESLSCISP